MSAVADVLNGAADLILRDGWAQGALGAEGAACAGVAVIRSSPSVRIQYAATRWFSQFIGSASIPRWNDVRSRTQAEVVAALRAAAEQAS